MFLKKIRDLTKRTSIRWRLTLLFVAIFGTSLATFGFGMFEFLSGTLQKEYDEALYNYAVDISESISLDPSGDLSLNPPRVDKEKLYPFSLGTALIQIRHRNGRILEQFVDFGELDLSYKKDIEHLSKGEDAAYRTTTRLDGLPNQEASSYRIITVPIDNNNPPQLILQIAVPLTILENQIRDRKVILEYGIPLILLTASLFAYFLSARALKPVREIIQKAHDIEVTNLSQRLPIPAAHDEVFELAVTLNQMIERLEKAFRSQERFVADASHQLLTPLTILKGELEQSKRAANWTPEQIDSLLQEVDRLTKLVQDLLVLARVDAGMGTLVLSPLFLDEVVLDAIGKVEKLARPRNIRLTFNIHSSEGAERPTLNGDEDLLSHLLINLMENAVKYSPDHSQIQVKLEQNRNTQHLVIEDSGPGLAEGELEMIFERFRRGRLKDGQTKPGYGLGLAIANQIARVHGGVLWAENRRNSDGSVAVAAFHFALKNF